MEINLFTLVVQIINFLVLLYLLKRFLYGPIMRNMEERERRIAQRFSQAEEARHEAEQEARRYRDERHELEQQREKIAAEAKQQIEEWREEALQNAYGEIERAKHDWREALNRDRENFLRQLEIKIGETTRKIASHALQDLANQSLEIQMADVFIQRIAEMDEAEQRQISEAIQQGENQVLLQSAFTLPETEQSRLRSAVQDYLNSGRHVDVKFECSPEIISGIELITDGHHINWTIRDYLDSLQEQVLQMIKEKSSLRELGAEE